MRNRNQVIALEKPLMAEFCDQNKSLTTGADTGASFAGTSGNDIFNGTGTSFTADDAISGGSGTDTLVINDTTGVLGTTRVGATVSGVEKMEITTAGRLGNVAGGTSASAGTSTFTYTDSTNNKKFTVSVNGSSIQMTAGATDTTGEANAALLNTALTNLLQAQGYTIVTTGTPTAGQIKVVLGTLSGAGGTTAVTLTTPAGVALPSVLFTSAEDAAGLPLVANTPAVAASGTTVAATYDVSGISLDSFKATATDVIVAKAKTTTAVDLTGTGSVTLTGGGGASKVTAGGGAVAIGSNDTTRANAFTSVTVAGTSTTVGITDNSGLAVDGVTVAVGSTLTTASVTGNTGLATVTGKGVAGITMARSSGGLTVTNANDHALTLGVAGVTAGTVTDATATSVAITGNASTTATAVTDLTGLTVVKAASISVAGSKKVNLGTISATKLDTFTVTGSGGVTADVSSAGATSTLGYVNSVDTSGSTAVLSSTSGTTANNITIGTLTSFTGGAGQDNVTVGASTKALSLGGGNDSLTLTALLATGSTADGGDGTDEIVIDVTNAATAGSSSGSLNAKISNFEVLSLSTDVVADGGETIDLGYLAKVNSYVKIAAMTSHSNDALTINNLATGGTIEFTGNNGLAAAGADVIVGVKDAAFSTTDVLNIKLTSDNAARAADNVTAVGVETVNIITNNLATNLTAATTTDTISLSGSTGLKYVNVTGNAGLTLTTTDTTVLSVNASGVTGTAAQPNAFGWTSGILTNTGKTIAVTGTSAGANTIDLDAITDTLMVSTITVGGTANVSANSFTGGAGVDNVTGGSGTDSFAMKEGRDVITTGAGSDKITFASLAVDRDTVTDFTSGAGGAGDKIISANFAGSAEYIAVTTRSAAYTATSTNTTGHTIEFAFEANSGKNLGDGSADSLTGVNLLKALNDGETAATITLTTTVDTDVAYVVAYQGGNAYVYAMGTSDNTTNTIVGSELALVGILQNVAVGAITFDNFVAS
jgi:S-layer protein